MFPHYTRVPKPIIRNKHVLDYAKPQLNIYTSIGKETNKFILITTIYYHLPNIPQFLLRQCQHPTEGHTQNTMNIIQINFAEYNHPNQLITH